MRATVSHLVLQHLTIRCAIETGPRLMGMNSSPRTARFPHSPERAKKKKEVGNSVAPAKTVGSKNAFEFQIRSREDRD